MNPTSRAEVTLFGTEQESKSHSDHLRSTRISSVYTQKNIYNLASHESFEQQNVSLGLT